MNKNSSPPAWAVNLFRWYCNDHLSDAALGDFIELHERRCRRFSKRKADLLFIANVIMFCQPFAVKKKKSKSYQPNSIAMLLNYFKVAWRNMTRQKMYTTIKLVGFAIGLTTCMVIFLYVKNEFSYDEQYGYEKNIYRIFNHYRGSNEGRFVSFPANMASLMKSNFPEVEMSGRLIPWKWFNSGNNLIRRDDQIENTYEEGFVYADNDLLQILEVPMIYGNTKDALLKPYSMVISKKMADKYFPNEDPRGKVVILNEDKTKPYTIGGVMKDFPANNHFSADFLITLTNVEFWPGEQTSWCCWNYHVYVKLRHDATIAALEKKMQTIRDKYYVGYLLQNGDASAADVKKNHSFELQPVKDIYLQRDNVNDGLSHGDIRFLWLFGGIASFILLLACINFINLSTAKSANRAREVGMRKVLGSPRAYLIRQFLTESLVYSFISFALALLFLLLALPYFNGIAGKSLSVPFATIWFVPSVIASSLFIGLLAGVYPSFYLSGFKPADVLKGSVSLGSKSSSLRSGMVVFQFTTSIVLLIGTFIIQRQMNFVLTQKVGFDKEKILLLHGAGTLEKNQKAFKSELLDLAGIDKVTINNYLPGPGTNRDQNGFWKEGRTKIDPSVGAQHWTIDEDYIPAMGIKLVEGRNFDPQLASDSSSIIINQALAKELGLKKPLGERIINWRPFTIIGVAEDFNFESMRQKIDPLAFTFGQGGTVVSVRAKSKNTAGLIESIKGVWQKFQPNQPFRYSFMDENYARMYDDVIRAGRLFAIFAALAIIVACLGLFALSSFMVEQRSKEISIRLVMGSSVSGIFQLLTKNFVKLILIAFVIATPISFFMMRKWLEDYTYRTTITIDVFILSGIMAVAIAILTVGYQSLKAAFVNPAKTLRSE